MGFLLLHYLINNRGWKRKTQRWSLMAARSPLKGKAGIRVDVRVGCDLRRRVQRANVDRGLHRHDGKINCERSRGGTSALVHGGASLTRGGLSARAQAALRHKKSGAAKQSHFEQVAPVHQAGLEQLLSVFESIVHLLEFRS